MNWVRAEWVQKSNIAKKDLLSVYISRSADNSLCALLSTPDSKSCACEHMVSHLKSGVRSGYLACRFDP
jgi:hypothetical protein